MANVTEIYGKDNVKFLVTVLDEENSNAPLDLSSATVEAAARKVAASGSGIAGSASVQDAANGVVLISFAAEAFLGAAGNYECQLRVTVGSDVQTVISFTFGVSASIVAA